MEGGGTALPGVLGVGAWGLQAGTPAVPAVPPALQCPRGAGVPQPRVWRSGIKHEYFMFGFVGEWLPLNTQGQN